MTPWRGVGKSRAVRSAPGETRATPSLTGLTLGLLISAIVRSQNTVIYLILLVLFVQIMFAGAIFDLPGAAAPISYLTPTRWALEALEGGAVGDRLSIVPPLLSDPRRAVRQKAAWLLAPTVDSLRTPELRAAFARARDEFIASQRYNADRADHRVAPGVSLLPPGGRFGFHGQTEGGRHEENACHPSRRNFTFASTGVKPEDERRRPADVRPIGQQSVPILEHHQVVRLIHAVEPCLLGCDVAAKVHHRDLILGDEAL